MATIVTSPFTIFALSTILTLFLLDSFLSNEDELHYAFANNKMNLSDFNFAAVGDWACTSNAENTLHNIIDKSPELVLGLGDYAYANNPDCWLNIIDPIDDKMKIVIGNHEHLIYTDTTNYYRSPELLKEYMNHFNLSKQFYAFDHQNVHFVAMSTEVPYAPGSEQYEFVENDLRKTVTNQSIDWIVVFYHRLAYTSPTFIDSVEGLRDIFHPLFEKYKVDLVMQGHAHNYQRSYPIKYNPEKTTKPIIFDKNTTNYHNPDGQIFTIIGTGGAPDIHNFTGTARYTAVQFNAFGFLNIDVVDNGTKLEGRFFENNGNVN